ncbi:hypothetical protein [Xanthocytophaga agilis]|nr:hypothetical protein [Xanthocytophaga agilis]
MKQIARNLLSHLDKDKKSGKPVLDLLVITHEHKDHISGFKQAEDELSDLIINELWFSWTEDEKHPFSADWKENQANDRKKLRQIQKEIQGVAQLNSLSGFLTNMLNFEADADLNYREGFGKNEIFEKIKKKVPNKKNILYHRPGALGTETGKTGKPICTIPGINIYVLGPPEDFKYLRKEDSRKKNELYIQADYTGDFSFTQSIAFDEKEKNFWDYVRAAPFDEEYIIPIDVKNAKTGIGNLSKSTSTPISQKLENQNKKLEKTDVYKSYFGTTPKSSNQNQNWRRIDYDWLQVVDGLALELNNHINNTSLVLAFEIEQTGEVMLFSGDAQYGVWLAWDDDLKNHQEYLQTEGKKENPHSYNRTYSWSRKDKKGKVATIHVEDLLARTILYKVGHHGSHNATPDRTGLSKLTSNALLALISVSPRSQWPSIPYANLLDAFDKRKVRYFRSDDTNLHSVPQCWKADTIVSVEYQNTVKYQNDVENQDTKENAVSYLSCKLTITKPENTPA